MAARSGEAPTVDMDQVERELLRTSARTSLAQVAPVPGPGDQGRAVRDLALQLGWTGLAGDLAAMVVVAEELGRAATGWPLPEVFVLERLLDDDALAARVIEGEVYPVLVDEATGLAEHELGATHGLRFGHDGPALHALLSMDDPGDAVRTAHLADAALWRGPGARSEARAWLALGLAARAVGAARAGHELAVQHAIDRVQFGQPIGSFQAVSHRLADAAVELAGWDALIASLDPDDTTAVLTAVVVGRTAALRAIGAAQRTLGAIGYFEEHALPWLFRRLHLDLDRQRSLVWAEHAVGQDLLRSARRSLLHLGPEAADVVERLTRDLDEIGFDPSPTLDDHPTVVAELGARGWIAPGLPKDVGGLGASIVEQMAVDVELQRRQVPVRVARGVAATLAGVLDTFGSDAQRTEFLPRIARGEFRCYLGYSEPDVGSDLASLRTRATRDGDEWVIDGTKLWGTGAHRADHVWLAARTGATAGRDGITVFLAPTGLPGWSCTEHRALSGEVACSTVFDGVRIPDRCRVGEVGGGWPVITSALAAERVVMAGLAGEVGRQLDELIAACRGRDGDAVAVTLGELAARQAVAEALLVSSARVVGDLGGFLDAAMAKLVTSELAELVARRAHDLLGVAAAVGSFDQALRLAPMYVIGGGTADIQRNLIARSLGLPRAPGPT